MRIVLIGVLFFQSLFAGIEKQQDGEFGNVVRSSLQFSNFLRGKNGDIITPSSKSCMNHSDFTVQSKTMLADSQGNRTGATEYLIVVSNEACLAPYTMDLVSFIAIVRLTWESEKGSRLEVLTGGLDAEKERIIIFGAPDKIFTPDLE